MNHLIQENFDGNQYELDEDKKKFKKYNKDLVQDSSSQTSQFRCLKSKRKSISFMPEATSGSLGHNTERKEGGAVMQSNREEKETEFSPYSIVWIIFPVINLCAEIAMDFIGVIMFFVKEIFMMTYNMIVPSYDNIFPQTTGLRKGRKHCFRYDWIRHVVLVLCPPAAIFMSDGLRGWLQILICAAATLFYYFPGLAYAIIVIGRSEVNSYMKMKQDPSTCSDDGSFGNFFISDKDNMAKCSRDVGQACVVGDENTKDKKQCCANPVLEGGQWKRLDSLALDPDGNPITTFEQGAVVCRNDTKKIKQAKGICVWKSTQQPT